MCLGEATRCKEELTIQGMSYIVIVWPRWLVIQASHAWFSYVLVARRQIHPGAGVYGCSLKKKREQSLHSVCGSLMPLWTNADRGCLAKELLVSLSKAWHVLWSVLHILQNDPPSWMCVKSVQCTLCSITVLVRCILLQSFVPYCSILPNTKINPKILCLAPCWPSTFSHNSHIS